MGRTWSYASYLKSFKDIEYAQIWAAGKSLSEVCPPYLKKEHEQIEKKIKALIRSCLEAKLDLNEVCFYDLISSSFLKQYAEIKNKICAHIFLNYKKPENYDHILNLLKVITDIKYNPISLKLDNINMVGIKGRNFVRKIKQSDKAIFYDPFKTVTGRLTTKPGTLPILTMTKDFRQIIVPENKWIFELDFNAAELRVMLGLLGNDQPTGDMHEWNLKNVYGGQGTREKAKKRIFAWLYNPKSKDKLSNQAYNREELLTKFWNGNEIHTVYNRLISADKHHALNYIIQSTAADLLFEQMHKVWKLLENKKSFIKFCSHDSIVIDLAEEDEAFIKDIKETFSQTRFGIFRINCFGGENWGNVKKMRIF